MQELVRTYGVCDTSDDGNEAQPTSTASTGPIEPREYDRSAPAAAPAGEWPAHVYAPVDPPEHVWNTVQSAISEVSSSNATLDPLMLRECHVSLSRPFAVRHKQRMSLLQCLRRKINVCEIPAGALAEPITFRALAPKVMTPG